MRAAASLCLATITPRMNRGVKVSSSAANAGPNHHHGCTPTTYYHRERHHPTTRRKQQHAILFRDSKGHVELEEVQRDQRPLSIPDAVDARTQTHNHDAVCFVENNNTQVKSIFISNIKGGKHKPDRQHFKAHELEPFFQVLQLEQVGDAHKHPQRRLK